MMSDAKIMTLNDLNGSEQFTKDYAPYRAVERSVKKGGENVLKHDWATRGDEEREKEGGGGGGGGSPTPLNI